MSQLSPPPHSNQLLVSFPQQHVLLISFNRPHHLNAITPQLTADIATVLHWFDQQPSLWVLIVTGQGRAFCAGADLKTWLQNHTSGKELDQDVHGFASISRRHTSSKPIIAAVNGSAYGGGLEIILNCDIVVASEDALFALPEVKRGVLAAQGVIPRLARAAGHQLASEMLLLGNTVTAVQARDKYRFVNIVVEKSAVLQTALDIAQQMNMNSPDSVQSSKEGLVFSQKYHFEESVEMHAKSLLSKRLYRGTNIKEGLSAFSERRNAKWTNPAKL